LSVTFESLIACDKGERDAIAAVNDLCRRWASHIGCPKILWSRPAEERLSVGEARACCRLHFSTAQLLFGAETWPR